METVLEMKPPPRNVRTKTQDIFDVRPHTVTSPFDITGSSPLNPGTHVKEPAPSDRAPLIKSLLAVSNRLITGL